MSRQKFHIPPTIIYTNKDGIEHTFVRNEELGHGSFATVFRVTDQKTNEVYAMKVISKLKCLGEKGKKLLEKIKNEIEIQSSLNHPNIVKSKYSFSDEFNYYFILEYCPGNDIREYLKKSSNGRLTEPETRKILKDVINGLICIHNSEIVHYDIKLENFLIDSKGKVKIADFGLSSFRKDEKGKNFSLCGTPNYLCPEILFKESREQSYKVDVWAVGVSAFIMLTGKGPFEGPTKEITMENIKKRIFYFPKKVEISDEAKSFIKETLKCDPYERPTAKNLLKHPFIAKTDDVPVFLFKRNHLPQLNKEIIPRSIQKVQLNIKNPKKAIIALPPIKISPEINFKYSVNENSNNVQSPKRPNISTNNMPQSPKRPNINTNNIPQSPKRPNINTVTFNVMSPKKTPVHSPRIITNNKRIVVQPSRRSINKISPRHYENKHMNTKIVSSNDIKNDFTVPSYFISRYCFYRENLSYLLGDGTVGVCFKDDSRMVMDPNEKFIQFYKNINSKPEVIDIEENEEEGTIIDEKYDDEIKECILFVKKVAKNFKKIRFSFNVEKTDYDSDVPLHNVNCFLKNDDSILFKLNDKNIQINFNDYQKMIIFWNTKKMCFFRNFKEKCNLIDMNTVASMNSNSDELKKYKKTKEMLSNLAITI